MTPRNRKIKYSILEAIKNGLLVYCLNYVQCVREYLHAEQSDEKMHSWKVS
jgi:hypothetical protein